METESENGKFERKRRQVQRLMDAEQTKIDSLEVKQNQLFEERYEAKEFLRIVQTQVILLMKSMPERDGSDKERL